MSNSRHHGLLNQPKLSGSGQAKSYRQPAGVIQVFDLKCQQKQTREKRGRHRERGKARRLKGQWWTAKATKRLWGSMVLHKREGGEREMEEEESNKEAAE